MNRLLKYSCLHEIYKQNVQIANYTNSCSNPPRRLYGPPEIKQAILSNGVKVASSRNDQPLAMLTITCQAGSRFEEHNERGVTHFLRNASSLTGQVSAFTRKRDFQQMGIYFTATGGKEFISYTIMGGKSNLEIACRYLVDAVFHNEFRPWEIDDLRSQILLELDTTDPRSQVMDMLHKAAFRGGLGNSIYCPRHKVNEIDQDSIRKYIEKNYISNRCFISSVGLDDGLAVYIGESLKFKKAAGTSHTSCFGVTCSAPYLGRGEAVRVDEEQRTVVALGVRASGDRHALAARAALACGARSALRKQFRALGAEADFFSVDYDGIGLFGVLLETEGHKMAQVCTRAADFLKTDLARMDELTAGRAKNILASDILRSVESSRGALSEMVLQMARGVFVHSINELVQNALALKESDIIDSAKTISRNVSELTVAAYGDVRQMPSVHELRSV